MTKRDLPALNIVELRNLLRQREVSPGETLQALEERINAVDPKIGAYLVHDLAAARAEAEKADVTLPLGGIPIAIKDLISFEDLGRLSCTLQCNRDREIARAGDDSLWPDEHGRIRHGFFDGKFQRAGH